MENATPEIYVCVGERLPSPSDEVEGSQDAIDAREVFGKLNGTKRHVGPTKRIVSATTCNQQLVTRENT